VDCFELDFCTDSGDWRIFKQTPHVHLDLWSPCVCNEGCKGLADGVVTGLIYAIIFAIVTIIFSYINWGGTFPFMKFAGDYGAFFGWPGWWGDLVGIALFGGMLGWINEQK